jgi:hemerythrin-like domain-containing protein
MINSFPSHSAPAVGFEVPLEMLVACHHRIEAQGALLHRLVIHLSVHGIDRQARDAADTVIRYFDTSARQHHADEEVDLFPALIESVAGSDAVCLNELIDSLSADHRELEHRWRHLRHTLAQVARGATTAVSADEAQAFTGLYERHIAREESELLPMAKRLLGDAELDRIGLAMRARRDPLKEPSELAHSPTQGAGRPAQTVAGR